MSYPTEAEIFIAVSTEETADVIRDVADERVRQVAQWGVQTRPDGTGGQMEALMASMAKARTDLAAADGSLTWRLILAEEVSEAFAETDPDKLRTELVQVAAVAVSWVEDIDRAVERARAAAEGASIDRAIAEGRLPLRLPGSGS